MDWTPATPGELIEDMEADVKCGLYTETCAENTEVLLHYIRGLERDSRALTEMRQALDGEILKYKMLERAQAAGAAKIRVYYEYAETDWRAIYGSAG